MLQDYMFNVISLKDGILYPLSVNRLDTIKTSLTHDWSGKLMYILRGIYSALRILKGNINFSRVCLLWGIIGNNP